MLIHEPNLRSNSRTNSADHLEYSDHSANLWGQLVLLAVLALVALMRLLR